MTASLQERVLELEAENFVLAAGACLCVTGDEHGNQYCSMKRRAEAAEDENVRLREALQQMEWACEQLAATRTQAIYTAMIDGGQTQELLELDNARRSARAALTKGTTTTGGENG